MMSPRMQADHALDVAIGRMAAEAYRQANQLANGRYRRKHVPYTLPAEAEILLEARGQLGREEITPDEAMALLHQPDILKARLV